LGGDVFYIYNIELKLEKERKKKERDTNEKGIRNVFFYEK